jgi:hypothetical protein
MLRVNKSWGLPIVAAAAGDDMVPPGVPALATGDLMLGNSPDVPTRPLLSTGPVVWSVTAMHVRDADDGVVACHAAVAAAVADAPMGLVGSCTRTPALRAMALTVSAATGPDPLSNDDSMTSAACKAQVTASAVPLPATLVSRDCLLRCRLSWATTKGELGANTSAPIGGNDGCVSRATNAASKACNCACSAIFTNTGASVPCSLITGWRNATAELANCPIRECKRDGVCRSDGTELAEGDRACALATADWGRAGKAAGLIRPEEGVAGEDAEVEDDI